MRYALNTQVDSIGATRMKNLFIIVIALSMFGCATHPKNMEASSVSSYQYKNYDCDQIGAEYNRVSKRCTALYNDLASEANADAAQMAVGLVVFWPTLLFLEGGDDARAAEYSELLGEKEELEKANILKRCEIDMEPTPVEPVAQNTNDSAFE